LSDNSFSHNIVFFSDTAKKRFTSCFRGAHIQQPSNEPTNQPIMAFSMSLKAMAMTLLLSSSAVVDVVNAQDACGAFSIVAAPSLVPLATAWVNQYNIEQCVSQSASRAAITVEEGGSSDSIARACGTASGASTVDVAGMTRLPFPGEASTENGWYYVCERSTRSLIGVSSLTSLFKGQCL
jgi:hypothetical protein